MKVRFNYADKKLNGVNKTSLKNMVERIFIAESKACESVDYIFCSDEYLLEINKSMLNHDYYTDIITFPLHEKGESVIAEIYISVDRVKDNAIANNATYGQELARVVAHGALHLCGYKDKSKRDIALMREKEACYISIL